MPKKKEKKAVKKLNKTNVLSQIKWGESYASLLLGIVVVIVVAVLVFAFIKNNNIINNFTDTSSTKTEELGKNQVIKEYVVKEGDDLWKISENTYGTGYNWTEIAKANNLENPGLILVGSKLIMPEIKSNLVNIEDKAETAVSEVNNNSIKDSTYTIKQGDDLWNIAVRAYGDGYKWVDIASANSLTNPDLIHVDNVIKIPR